MTKAKKGIFKYCPLFAIVSFALFAFAVFSYYFSIENKDYANFIASSISPTIRAVTAGITHIFPFSFAELLLISSPVLAAVLVWLCIKKANRSNSEAVRYVLTLFGIVALVFTLFVFSFAVSYRSSSIDEQLEINSTNDITPEELRDTAKILLDDLNASLDNLTVSETGRTLMPYSYNELSKKLCEAYESLSRKYECIPVMTSRVKPIIMSNWLTYTHISGIYTFFTGEANINTNYPDYIVVASAAHEMAHQRGVAREDEANFIAFLVGMESDDSYIRYSALLSLYDDVAAELYSVDKSLYSEVAIRRDEIVVNELRAYSEFFTPYRDNTAAKVTEKTNDSYLQSQGQSAGTRSYGLVTKLAVAYILYGDYGK